MKYEVEIIQENVIRIIVEAGNEQEALEHLNYHVNEFPDVEYKEPNFNIQRLEN